MSREHAKASHTDPAGSVEPEPELNTEFKYTDLVGALDTIGKDRPWVVEGAFEGQPLVVWTAAEKSGKTWAAIDLCVSMVVGDAWLGSFVAKGNGPPLYLDGEVGEYDFARRAARIARGRGQDPRAVLRDIRHLSSRGFYLSRECEYLVPCVRDIKALRPSIVIIDPWRNHILGDENSARDTLDAMNVAAILRDAAHAPVIVLHHLNRAGTMSGSRALRTRADMILEGTDEAEPRYCAVGRTLRAGDAIARPFRVVVEHEDDTDDRIARTTVRARFEDRASKHALSRTAARLLEALRVKSREGATPASLNALGKAGGVQSGSARSAAAKELLAAGLAHQQDGGWVLATEEFFAAVGPAEGGR